jgi:hypothetical protein
VFQYGDAYLARNLLGAAIPLCGVAAVCRGRVRVAIAASCAMSALYALPFGSLLAASAAYAGGPLARWHGAGILTVQAGLCGIRRVGRNRDEALIRGADPARPEIVRHSSSQAWRAWQPRRCDPRFDTAQRAVADRDDHAATIAIRAA